MLQVPILMMLSGDVLREIGLFLASMNIHRNMPFHQFCLSCIKLLLFLPLGILHSIFSHSTHCLPTVSELNGSIPASVPEGGLTLPLHFCASPSCGAAVGVTKGSLHLRGQPTSSRESGMKSSGWEWKDYRATNLFLSKKKKKDHKEKAIPFDQRQNVGWGSLWRVSMWFYSVI